MGEHWFEDIADHLGSAYLRYSFTKGTEQEIGFLVEVLGLEPGMRVLDVGCGPGRHAHALGRRGIAVHGVDISHRFVDLAIAGAPPGVTFERLDARRLRFDHEFDAVICLCQGAFGLSAGPGSTGTGAGGGGGDGDGHSLADPDGVVLEGMARALRPGRRLALSAFSSYFQVRWLDDQMTFDADRGLNHEHTTIKDEDGVDAAAELWTTCFTPRELRLMCAAVGLRVQHLWSVDPGAYRRDHPDLTHSEFLVVAIKPGVD